MLKAVAFGYSASELFTRSYIFYLITGCKNIQICKTEQEVSSAKAEVVFFNCEKPVFFVGDAFSKISRCKAQIVVYTDSPINRVLAGLLKECSKCSLLICPDEIEIEECRKALQSKTPYTSRMAEDIFNAIKKQKATWLNDISVMQREAIFYKMQGLSGREIADKIGTTEGTVRVMFNRLRHSMLPKKGALSKSDFDWGLAWVLKGA